MPEEKILEKIGLPAVLEQCAEECSELGKACLKLARKLRDENPTPMSEEEIHKNIEEEIADVLTCFNVIGEAHILNSEYISIIMKRKLMIITIMFQ